MLRSINHRKKTRNWLNVAAITLCVTGPFIWYYINQTRSSEVIQWCLTDDDKCIKDLSKDIYQRTSNLLKYFNSIDLGRASFLGVFYSVNWNWAINDLKTIHDFNTKYPKQAIGLDEIMKKILLLSLFWLENDIKESIKDSNLHRLDEIGTKFDEFKKLIDTLFPTIHFSRYTSQVEIFIRNSRNLIIANQAIPRQTVSTRQVAPSSQILDTKQTAPSHTVMPKAPVRDQTPLQSDGRDYKARIEEFKKTHWAKTLYEAIKNACPKWVCKKTPQ